MAFKKQKLLSRVDAAWYRYEKSIFANVKALCDSLKTAVSQAFHSSEFGYDAQASNNLIMNVADARLFRRLQFELATAQFYMQIYMARFASHFAPLRWCNGCGNSFVSVRT